MLRRTLLGSALAVAGGTMLPRQAVAADTITVVSFGGAYQEAESKALFQPAAKALGITVKEETYAGIADLRLKAKANAVTWDVVASGSGTAAHAGAEGILEPLDYKIIDVSTFVPNTWQDFAVGGDVFSTVLAWNTNTYGDHPPQSWADFWDVKKFPGKRSYRNAVMLEPPLIADGVPLDKVYEVLSSPGGIERAIKKAQGGETDNYEEIRYEGFGPGGIGVIVEALTDNRNRAASSIRTAFNKAGGNLGETGSVAFMFDRLGQITYPPTAGSEDAMMEAAIEAGAEDVESDEEGHVVYTAFEDLGAVIEALEAALGPAKSTAVIWKPKTLTPVETDTATSLFKLIDVLDEDDDVQNVWTNVDLTDEQMAALAG